MLNAFMMAFMLTVITLRDCTTFSRVNSSLFVKGSEAVLEQDALATSEVLPRVGFNLVQGLHFPLGFNKRASVYRLNALNFLLSLPHGTISGVSRVGTLVVNTVFGADTPSLALSLATVTAGLS